MSQRIPVGILGATGAVGQRFVQLLADHPQFEVRRLYASEVSAGKSYAEAVTWRVPAPMPANLAAMPVHLPNPDDDLALVFSALHKDQAEDLEPRFAAAGKAVVSNASTFRMTPDVPLLIPEINADHTGLIELQRKNRGWSGFIVTNPNCASIGLVLPLKPLHDAFGIEECHVVTMQARSGAGYPGPSEEVIYDNVVPFIGGEEDKLETEPNKILGTIAAGAIQSAGLRLSAACHRVNVLDGHLKAVSVRFKRKPASVDEIHAVVQAFNQHNRSLGLPSLPEETVIVHTAVDRPQPKLDRDAGAGQSVHLGRVRPCPILDYKMIILSHNTIRGAAGAALLNAELLLAQGYLG